MGYRVFPDLFVQYTPVLRGRGSVSKTSFSDETKRLDMFDFELDIGHTCFIEERP